MISCELVVIIGESVMSFETQKNFLHLIRLDLQLKYKIRVGNIEILESKGNL